MFKKIKLRLQMKSLIKRIEKIERKRSRSQAGLVDAILTNSSPADEDVDFFNRYTDQINELRHQVNQLKKLLEN